MKNPGFASFLISSFGALIFSDVEVVNVLLWLVRLFYNQFLCWFGDFCATSFE